MIYVAQFLALESLHLPIMMFPGAVFTLVAANSLAYSRRIGLYSALGIIIGTSVHLTYTLIGLGFLVENFPWVLQIVRTLGVIYMLYLGTTFLFRKTERFAKFASPGTFSPDMTPFQALRAGFLIELLNPYVALFFLSIFTQVIQPETPGPVLAAFGAGILTITFCYFALVGLFFSSQAVQAKLDRFAPVIQKAFGIIIILFSLRLAFANLGG